MNILFPEFPEWLPSGMLPAQQTVTISQSAMLASCMVRGRPLPTIQWMKNDLPIGDHDGLYTIVTKQQPVDSFSYNVTSTLLWHGNVDIFSILSQ